MFLDDSVASAQAETSSLPNSLGRVKRFENMLGLLNPRAGIRKFDAYMVPDRSDRNI